MPRRMSYSAATTAMQRMVAAHAESEQTGVPVDELLEQGGSERQRSAALARRTFLAGAVASAGLIAMPSVAQADRDGIGGKAHKVKVVSPVFVDPQGARQNV